MPRTFLPYQLMLIIGLIVLGIACDNQSKPTHIANATKQKISAEDHRRFLQHMSEKVKKACSNFQSMDRVIRHCATQRTQSTSDLEEEQKESLREIGSLISALCWDKDTLHGDFNDLKRVGYFFQGEHTFYERRGIQARLGDAHQLMLDSAGWCHPCAQHLTNDAVSDLLNHIHEYLDYISAHKDDFGFYTQHSSKTIKHMAQIMRKATEDLLLLIGLI